MNFRPLAPEAPKVGLTPLIDVVLLLLIFFMVSTSFERSSGLQLALPEVDSEVSAPPATLRIDVDRDGRYWLNDSALAEPQAESLAVALADWHARDNAPEVVALRADGRASHQQVVTVMDLVGKAGFASVSIATVGK